MTLGNSTYVSVFSVFCLMACVQTRSDDHLESRAPLSSAAEIIAAKHGVPVSEVHILDEAPTHYYHLESSLDAYKYCLGNCAEEIRSILLDSEAVELDEPTLEEVEVEYVKEKGLKLAPSLRARFEENPGARLTVVASLQADAEPVRYQSWDEEIGPKEEQLLEERQAALSRLMSARRHS